jgi:hypothetical protein
MPLVRVSPSISRPSLHLSAETQCPLCATLILDEEVLKHRVHADWENHSTYERGQTHPDCWSRSLRQLAMTLACPVTPDLGKIPGFAQKPVEIEGLRPPAVLVLRVPGGNEVPGDDRDIKLLPPQGPRHQLVEALAGPAHRWIARVHGHKVLFGNRNYLIEALKAEGFAKALVPDLIQNLSPPGRRRRGAAFDKESDSQSGSHSSISFSELT